MADKYILYRRRDGYIAGASVKADAYDGRDTDVYEVAKNPANVGAIDGPNYVIDEGAVRAATAQEIEEHPAKVAYDGRRTQRRDAKVAVRTRDIDQGILHAMLAELNAIRHVITLAPLTIADLEARVDLGIDANVGQFDQT